MMASKLKAFLEQVHHRSLWQTFLAYGAGCVALLSGVDLLQGVIGFSDWVIRAAAVICIAALPLVIVTAYIQKRGIGGPELVTRAPEKGLRRWFSWRNVAVVLGAAFAILASGTGGYLGLRVAGIGPWGTLQAKGLLPDTARLLVADVKGSAGDSAIAGALTEAIFAGLAQSPVLRVVSREELSGVLSSMREATRGPLPDSLAREVAVRAGIPVVVLGDLRNVGNAYQLSVRMVDPDRNRVLLAHSETAESEEDLITEDGAVDRLTGHLRERIGEPLRSLRHRDPLPLVTTSSLEALKLFARARGLQRAERQASLEAAVDLDPEFGMAWRSLAGSYGQSSEKGILAFERAFALADRLSERERLYVTGAYYLVSNIDYVKSAEANRRLAALYPDYSTGWVNLSQALYRMGAYEEYQEVCLRAIEINVNYNTTWNLWDSSLLVRDTANAWRAIDLARKSGLVDSGMISEWEGKTAYMAGDYPRARRHLNEWTEFARDNGSLGQELFSHLYLGVLEGVQGRRTGMQEAFRRGKEVLETRTILGISSAYLDYLLALGDRMVLDHPNGRERAREALHAWEAGLPADYVFDLTDALEFAGNGRPERAQEILDAWEARTPERLRATPNRRMRVLTTRGGIARAEGRTEEGFELLRAASDAGTASAEPHGILARAYDESGMADSAVVAYRRYVDGPHFVDRLNLDHLYLPVAYERLGQLYEERGELEEAARYHALFVELWTNADPELQPRVRAARETIERIRGRGGPEL